MAPTVPEVSLVFDHSHSNNSQESRMSSSKESTELSRSRDSSRTIDSYASWRQKRFSPDYNSKKTSTNEVQYSSKSNQESRQVQRSLSDVDCATRSQRNVAQRDQGNFKEEAARQMYRSHSAQTLPSRMAIQHERDYTRQSLPSRMQNDNREHSAPSPRRLSEAQHLQRKRHNDSHQSPVNNEIMQLQYSGQR